MTALAKPAQWWPGVARNHALAPAAAWVLWEGAGDGVSDAVDQVRGSFVNLTTDAWIGSPYGWALEFDSGAAHRIDVPFLGIARPAPFAYAMLLKPAAGANKNQAWLSETKAAAAVPVAKFQVLSGSAAAYVGTDAGSALAADTVAITDGGWHFCVMSSDTATLHLYVDGDLVATDSMPAGTGLADLDTCTIGSFVFTTGGSPAYHYPAKGELALMMMYRRHLGRADVAALTMDPFRAFRRSAPLSVPRFLERHYPRGFGSRAGVRGVA